LNTETDTIWTVASWQIAGDFAAVPADEHLPLLWPAFPAEIGSGERYDSTKTANSIIREARPSHNATQHQGEELGRVQWNTMDLRLEQPFSK
jgi:hypothetical protein